MVNYDFYSAQTGQNVFYSEFSDVINSSRRSGALNLRRAKPIHPWRHYSRPL